MNCLFVRLFFCIPALLLAANLSFAAANETSPPDPSKTVAPKENKRSYTKKKLLDINTATEEQLATLPGLSGKDVKNIIANRPYTRKNQLKQKKIITAATYEGIKKRIVAKRRKK